jgi:hypothetical protein
MRRIDFIKLTASLGACYLAAFIGSIFTAPEISTWYATLARPTFAPPRLALRTGMDSPLHHDGDLRIHRLEAGAGRSEG